MKFNHFRFFSFLILSLSASFCVTARAQSGSDVSDPDSTRAVIEHMRTPVRSVPLSVVVETLTGHKVLPFNTENPNHAEVLKRLNRTAEAVAAKIKAEGGISSKRVNEVGNIVEKYVREALTAQELPASIPTGEKSGRARATGYPDITFTYNGERFYIDCKTYNKDTLHSTMRTFYLSPSDDSKVSCDAVHLIISFETARHGDNYQLVHYKFVSLENLTLDVKYEFNTDNRRMYSDKNGAITIADAACE